MRVGRFRGLRFEILGNLAVVSLISLFLTGFGVWFINGRQMLQQNLLQGRLLVESFAEEMLELFPVDATTVAPDDPERRKTIHGLMRRYREKDPRIQFSLVGPDMRVMTPPGQRNLGALSEDETLLACFKKGKPCTRLDGRARFLGYFHEATFALPLQREGETLGGILAVFSLEGVLASARQTVEFILLYVSLGALIFLIFGTILLSRTLVHPLERTIRVMQRMADGDLQQKVEPAGENEVGLLARTFNKMAEKLKAHEKSLNEHVKSLKNMNHELKVTQQEVIQSEKLASVGLLAAGLAHEIGNPLGTVLGYISMLERGAVKPEEQKDYLKRMENEVLRIDNIVRDLQEYSKPSPHKIIPADLNEVIRDTVKMVERQRDFRNIGVNLFLEEPLPRVRLDPGQMQQVLVNLFLNAKDAMEGKGTLRVISRRSRYVIPDSASTAGRSRREDDPPGVDFRLLRKGNPARKWPFLEGQELVELAVVDSGPGISQDDLSRVFDPFFTTKETGHGTGLGLSVSQRIIESFHGEIEIISPSNENTQVKIRLPAANSDEDCCHPPREETLKDGTTAAHRG